ncbi:hypothetical protein HanPI659440_Chr12g0459681 [Helianthus annuus]|nr:hypothetical protein HanPI659440_Chr12g0459681 [Helianthus annuus]
MFNDKDDAKFDTFFSSLLEMEDLKKKFKENWDSKTKGQGKSSVVCDEDSTMKDDPKAKTIVDVYEDITLTDKSMSHMDLDNFLIPKNVMVSEPSLRSTVVSEAITNNTVDVRQSVLPREIKAPKKCKSVMVLSDESVIAHRTRSKYRNKKEAVVDNVTTAKTGPVCRKHSNLKITKIDAFIEFTKVAENRLRLPCAVSDELCLSVDNLHEVSIKKP